jgi:hypothetical protein
MIPPLEINDIRGRLTRADTVTLLLAALISCSSPRGSVSVTPLPGMEQRVQLSVSRGRQPDIRWAPDSAVAWVHVGRVDKNERVWEITDSANSIRPPVHYGVTPPGATEKALMDLEPGVEYDLSIGRWELYRGYRIITQIARVRFRAARASR